MKFARSSTGGRHIHLRFGRAGLLCLAVAFLQPSILKPAFAADKPPPRPDAAAPAVTPSSISATLEFDLPALDRALERRIPRRLATFDDRVTNCWHRRLF